MTMQIDILKIVNCVSYEDSEEPKDCPMKPQEECTILWWFMKLTETLKLYLAIRISIMYCLLVRITAQILFFPFNKEFYLYQTRVSA